jgi:hypothetical protein
VHDVVGRYARYHFAPAAASAMQGALFGLEQNWLGDIGTNQRIASTLQLLQTAERLTSPNERRSNWRLQMYLYRGYYDAYVQARFLHEQQIEKRAIQALANASATGTTQAINLALSELCCVQLVPGCSNRSDSPIPRCDLPPPQRGLRTRVLELHAMINASVGVTVVQRQTKDLNLASIDTPLNDAAYLALTVAIIANLPSEAQRQDHITALLNQRTDPAGDGGVYMNMGPFGSNRTHGGGGGGGSSRATLVAGQGPNTDPAYYFSPLAAAWPAKHHGGFSKPCARSIAWTMWTSTFYDQPFEMVFTLLDSHSQYTLGIVYFTSPGAWPNVCSTPPSLGCNAPVRLMANHQHLHGYRTPPQPMQVLEFPLASALTSNGTLRLRCNQRPGAGGDGRACCVSEVWLRKTTTTTTTTGTVPTRGLT